MTDKDDKEMMRKGRGNFEEKSMQADNCVLTYVRWHDNKVVNLLSSFAKARPISKIPRKDSKLKRTVEVDCPDIVKVYNSSMGGVDLADQLIALYRIELRSKKNYLRLFFHMLDMIIVNC